MALPFYISISRYELFNFPTSCQYHLSAPSSKVALASNLGYFHPTFPSAGVKGMYHYARLVTAFLMTAFFVGVKYYLMMWCCEMCVWALSISWHVTSKMLGIANEFY